VPLCRLLIVGLFTLLFCPTPPTHLLPPQLAKSRAEGVQATWRWLGISAACGYLRHLPLPFRIAPLQVDECCKTAAFTQSGLLVVGGQFSSAQSLRYLLLPQR